MNIHTYMIYIIIYIYKYVYLHTYIHTCMYPHDVFICVPWPGHARGTGGDRSAKILGVWWGVIHLVKTMDKYHPHLMSNKTSLKIPEVDRKYLENLELVTKKILYKIGLKYLEWHILDGLCISTPMNMSTLCVIIESKNWNSLKQCSKHFNTIVGWWFVRILY